MDKILLIIGIALLTLSTLFYYFGDYLKWFGYLPGDIRMIKNSIAIKTFI